MRPPDEEALRRLLDDYLRLYANRDDSLTSWFSQDFSGFTGGGDFLVKDRARWVDITRQDFEQIKQPIRLDLKDVSLQALADGVAVANAFFTIHLPIADHFLSRKTARLVLIFRREDGGWKICHSSISIPVENVRSGEVYPLQDLLERNRFLEDLVGERTRQLSQANGDLQHRNAELAEKVLRQREAEEALRTSQAEAERLQGRVRRLEKAESLGRMASAIAHLFNNHLHAVILGLETAVSEPGGSRPSNEDLVDALDSARKAAGVSSQMLTYLGQTGGTRELLSLGEACERALARLGSLLPAGVTLEQHLPTTGPLVRSNAGQLQQVLGSLVTNASEAMAGRSGAIRLSVSTVRASQISVAGRFPLDAPVRDQAYACLEVEDAGCGIAPADVEKLFDPFFSTKQTGRGLGLPSTLGIVKAHGGLVTVESTLGQGSRFRIYLPLAATLPGEQHLPTDPPRRAVAGATVLVVDDEPALRRVATRVLTRHGFEVLTAEDGFQAVQLMKERPGQVDCVLCDVTMPRMNGWETLSAVKAIDPGCPVILASGYSEAEVMQGSHPEVPEAFLSKPFESAALLASVRRVLGA